MIRTRIIVVVLIIIQSSCVPYTSLLNYDQSDIPSGPQPITNYEPLKIQSNDILKIDVSGTNFNPDDILTGNPAEGYLVGPEGTIDFPLIGKVNLKGLSIEEAKSQLANDLKKYFVKEPIVNMRLINFKINVHGEVSNPGAFTVQNERVSIIDAITLAGDFTEYSRRDSILIIREVEQTRTFGYVDFNKIELLNSPYFFLKQNDVIYVQPERRIVGTVRDRETKYIPWITAAVSIILLVTTLIRVGL